MARQVTVVWRRDIAGSTVVDLSRPGGFKILRAGCAETQTVETMQSFGLAPIAPES